MSGRTAARSRRKNTPGRPASPHSSRQAARKFRRSSLSPIPRWRGWLCVAFEAVLLGLAGMIATIAVLGRAGNWFGGTGLTESLLPFAGTVLILAIAGSLLLWLWLRIRRPLRRAGVLWPVAAATLVCAGAVFFASGGGFRDDLRQLRTLVGGVEQAGRDAIGHQVYAAYRRTDLGQMQTILSRSRAYWPVIREASRRNDVSEEVLIGLGAAESSFLPRDSHDGGRGLFQITAPPEAALRRARQQLGISRLDFRDPRQNAYLAAATLRHYLDEMHDDLFLALLAYNIGPRNGGLRTIMQRYGARDFFTIQPYLQHLPRDYPIRVLTAALAFRVFDQTGALPRFEDGDNARVIQSLGIPGLD